MRVSARPVLTAAPLRVEGLASRSACPFDQACPAWFFPFERAPVARSRAVSKGGRRRSLGCRRELFGILTVKHQNFPDMLHRERSGSLANRRHESAALAALAPEYAHFDEFVRLEAPVDLRHDIVGESFSADQDHRLQFVRERLEFAAPLGRQFAFHTADSSL